jgi:hypothetical protein
VDNLMNAGAAFPQMLGRQLLNRLTINWLPMEGWSVHFTQPRLIEQISHTVDAQTFTWSTTFAVTPIGTQITPLIFDSAPLGILDVDTLGY